MTAEAPVLSVIIPTAGRPELLAGLLDSLRRQEFDTPFEIAVVNDRPGTDLSHLAFEDARRGCRILPGAGNGPAPARNLGVTQTRGPFLLFLDDDAVVDPQFLRRILKHLEAFPAHAISGLQMAMDRKNIFSLTAEWLHHSFVEGEFLKGKTGEGPLARFAASNPLALKRAGFIRCAGFDPSFPLAAGEDREFCMRWLAAGFRIRVVKEASIGHRFPASLAALMKQQWRYGRGALHFDARVSTVEKLRVRPFRYYARLLTQAPRRYGIGRGAAVGVLAWFAQAAMACGYLYERRRWNAEAREGLVEKAAAK